ncbi:MAG: iron-sulfur cluster assembly scaffold protein, partial [Candidatus Limnocylindrales bacterium]
MDSLYRDEILEHYRRPHNFGTLEHPDVSYEGSNPLCGDRITLMLDLDDTGHVS